MHNSQSMSVAGVDEVGRGPLAGPVIAAAVILHPKHCIAGLADSKALSERRRESLFGEIKDRAVAWAIGRAEVEEIDRINILQATLLAMQRAVASLAVRPEKVLVDGIHCPAVACPVQAIVKGDKSVPAIAAASIIAKVTRDAEMVLMDEQYPGYGLASHKGYPTKQHISALQELGPCRMHRKSFAPVKKVMALLALEEKL